jgi:hypothetical protein
MFNKPMCPQCKAERVFLGAVEVRYDTGEDWQCGIALSWRCPTFNCSGDGLEPHGFWWTEAYDIPDIISRNRLARVTDNIVKPNEPTETS